MNFSQPPESISFPHGPVSVAGIHLSGANTRKTSMVILAGNLPKASLKVKKIYEKIGSYGRMFSDERLVQILQIEGPFDQVFVDAPLSAPPCVLCQRQSCPGVAACEDISVAYMMAMVDRHQQDKKRRHRPVNPQNQRLWDVFAAAEHGSQSFEPTYHPNVAQLATRARTLHRRLRGGELGVELRETSVGKTLTVLATKIGLASDQVLLYRNFEHGRRVRLNILQAILRLTPEIALNDDESSLLSGSLELFQAFITSYVAMFAQSGLCRFCPDNFVEKDGWVFLPDFP